MIHGVFDYQVPGMSQRTCGCHSADKPERTARQPFAQALQGNSPSERGEQNTQLRDALLNLFTQLVQQLGLLLPAVQAAPIDGDGNDDNGNGGVVTTQAVGEEDGGVVTTQAVGEEDGGNIKPPIDVTTLAIGEEDGGINPKPPIDSKPPIDVTTFAIGEEDGGINPEPPIKPEPPNDVTTLAIGEEDGGNLKPPTDVTTQATGEEDGGQVTTQAYPEEN